MAKVLIIAIVPLLIFTHKSIAFTLNPLENKYKNNDKNFALLDSISSPVHEEITKQALLCAKKADLDLILVVGKCSPNDYKSLDSDNAGYLYNPIIRGVWWNDDPNQLLYGASYGKWLAWMRDGAKIAKTKKNYLGKNRTITKDYYMQYRSHYGDLQFLHAMANDDGIAASITVEGILTWAEFAYAVAIGNISPNTTLSEVTTKNFQNYFNHRGGWSVHYLFAPKWTLGSESINEVALGTLLHMIQDSYSEAHVERVYEKTDKCSNGRIVQFHSYVKQDHKKHGNADKRSAWLKSSMLTELQNPVRSSAMIIGFVRQKADWDKVVLPYLKEDVFCTDKDAEKSTPGNYL